MKSIFRYLLFILICCITTPRVAHAINTKDTRLLTQPAISKDHIAFVYANDLWIANRDGSQPRRLTVDEGVESNPAFSPDGSLIAFSAEYDGNTDVFVVPVEGGIPTRLTWHPYADYVRGFTPDGKSVLFASGRTEHTNRYLQFFTVPVTGGFPEKLPVPNGWKASYSPDGNFIAYTPIPGRYKVWKHYRGGTVATIWILNLSDYSVVKIPQPEGRCNDTDPMWMGDRIYFRSDRNGEFNLFSYSVPDKTVIQHTRFTDFPVVGASKGDGTIIFEQAGYLHTFQPSSEATARLKIPVAADLLELRPRYVSGDQYIRSVGISATGKRVVMDFRGDIITVPAEKGDPRNITLTTGVHEKYPAWSPDGKRIAYFSDASGEYALHIASQDGNTKPRVIPLNGTGFYAFPHWSPDSKKICFVDNGRNLYMLDIATGMVRKIDADEMYVPGPFRDLFGDWSADAQWISYTKVIETNYKRIYLYSVEQGKSFPLTDGMSDATSPVFDPGGKYIYFLASTDAGPVVNWFDQSNIDMVMTSSIYLATLSPDLISPFAKESDEEPEKENKPAETPAPKKGKKNKAPKTTTGDKHDIVVEGIQERIVAFPIKAGNYSQPGIAEEGKLFYLARPVGSRSGSKLHMYDLDKRKDKEIMAADFYRISADGKKMLYSLGRKLGITNTGTKPKPENGFIKTSQIEVKIDPVREWPQIFDEAWRINRDYFYDPGMHGADWPAMKVKYARFLPDLSCRNDLNRVIEWMCSEVSVGHHRLSGRGDQMSHPGRVSGGLLGADYEITNNRYRFSKIFGGLNWNPGLRSPLTEPGVNIHTGEYLLAVNGKDLVASDNLFSMFENTAGKIVELTVSPVPDYSQARTVQVVPVSNESALRNREWVEGNLKKVEEATNSQVAYVYVPNTARAGHEYFKRYFFPQANRKAIIVDERYNGGGSLADYYIDILLRPYQAHWNFRYGKDLKSPSASIQGPKVMIIDETAGSGGDMLPWMFRKFKVGTLVGKRTWGGLVGVLGFPEFIDGASVTAPNVAIWTKDGFIVENVGVPPDIEVEQWPADIIKGKDPQLEKAIEIIMKQLKENPPEEPVRPPYPVKVKK
ncbi:MAG: peptidase S41 [Chlorobi bacterium]|nr:peptidase S41 [Chlorobiota bacterium]